MKKKDILKKIMTENFLNKKQQEKLLMVKYI